ncbi:MAG: hypothetical protein ACYCVN_12325 [Acidimicrobiales bacterium]
MPIGAPPPPPAPGPSLIDRLLGTGAAPAPPAPAAAAPSAERTEKGSRAHVSFTPAELAAGPVAYECNFAATHLVVQNLTYRNCYIARGPAVAAVPGGYDYLVPAFNALSAKIPETKQFTMLAVPSFGTGTDVGAELYLTDGEYAEPGPSYELSDIGAGALETVLTAPLELPALPGKPLTTQGGSTLDDGSGDMTVKGTLAVDGATTLAAPLVLPAVAGEPLTTEGGSTLDDGSGNAAIAGSVGTGGNATQSPDDALIIGPNTRFAIVDYGTASISIASGRWNMSSLGPDVLLGNGQVGLSPPSTVVGLAPPPNTAATLSSGSGAPAISGNAGDLFFRIDTPTVAGQRIYICTVAGAAGAATWLGIV